MNVEVVIVVKEINVKVGFCVNYLICDVFYEVCVRDNGVFIWVLV